MERVYFILNKKEFRERVGEAGEGKESDQESCVSSSFVADK